MKRIIFPAWVAAAAALPLLTSCKTTKDLPHPSHVATSTPAGEPAATPTPPDLAPTPTPAPEPTPTPTPANASVGSLPYATPEPGKPGFVRSPYASDTGLVDVRGFPPGTEVKDPYSGKTFLVP